MYRNDQTNWYSENGNRPGLLGAVQALGVVLQVNGFGSVSYLGHAVGLLCAAFYNGRKEPRVKILLES